MEKKTIREVAALWKSDKQQYVKQSTMSAYALILENHILPAFGEKSHLAEDDVQAFALQKLNDGLSQKTVKDILIVLKMIQKFGVKAELLEFTDWSIKYPTEQKSKELEVLSISHQKKLMQYVTDNFTFRNLGIYICLSTGMRIGEVCALQWSDVNIEKRIITVRKTVQRIQCFGEKKRTKIVVTEPKSASSVREIPIPSRLIPMLMRCKSSQEKYVISGSMKPLEPRAMQYRFARILRNENLPSVHFHSLRHSFATNCIALGFDVKTLSEILGHSSVEITLNRYVHSSIERKRACMDLLSVGF